MGQPPTPVPLAKQVGEVRARWAWTEPPVWTERMRTALEEQGLFSLKAAHAAAVNPL